MAGGRVPLPSRIAVLRRRTLEASSSIIIEAKRSSAGHGIKLSLKDASDTNGRGIDCVLCIFFHLSLFFSFSLPNFIALSRLHSCYYRYPPTVITEHSFNFAYPFWLRYLPFSIHIRRSVLFCALTCLIHVLISCLYFVTSFCGSFHRSSHLFFVSHSSVAYIWFL